MNILIRTALVAGLVCLLGASAAFPGETNVAVAGNFTAAARAIAERFEAETNHEVTLVFGSTGKHYAQIRNGAPFAAFLAADVRRPRLLQEEERVIGGVRFTYAIGRIVLWSPDEALVDSAGAVLGSKSFRHLAIANPKLAPYGEAARQVIESLGLSDELQGRIVRGENVGQTFQFIRSGNAELGFVAASQLAGADGPQPGSRWEPPIDAYEPIEQQAVLLSDDPAARAFLEYLRGETARRIMADYGYGAP